MASESTKLVEDIMCMLEVHHSMYKAFKVGRILRTYHLANDTCLIVNITEEDKLVISRLSEQRLLVYGVLQSTMLINGSCSPVEMVSYLYVQEDIIASAGYTDVDLERLGSRETIIAKWVHGELESAKNGYLYAYVLNGSLGLSEFGVIKVDVINGNLIRRS